MGNKLAGSPFPSYESAAGQYSAAELSELKAKFTTLCGGQNTINLAAFVKKGSHLSPYTQRQICPRIFNVLDIKKDSVIDFEEYVCAIAVFRSKITEDKAKCVYMMYVEAKSAGSISKDNLRQLVVDSGMCSQRNDVALPALEQWMTEMKGLSQAAVEAVFVQYATHVNKMDLLEFLYFAKNDPSVKVLISLIGDLLE